MRDGVPLIQRVVLGHVKLQIVAFTEILHGTCLRRIDAVVASVRVSL